MPAKMVLEVWSRVSLGLLFAFAFLLTACQMTGNLPEGMSPVMATWYGGEHFLPFRAIKGGVRPAFHPKFRDPSWKEEVRKRLKDPEAKLPAVLLLQGCVGIVEGFRKYQDLFLSLGYVVFMPDSFQRPGRLKCNLEGPLSDRVALRYQEIEFAQSRIRQIPWIDQDRIILMGHSEGGNSTDSWPGRGFAAHIISSSACRLGKGFPAAPEGVPVLAMVGEKDLLRPTLSCTVRRTVGGSRSIRIPGAGHDIYEYPETDEAIKKFLKECCSASALRKR